MATWCFQILGRLAGVGVTVAIVNLLSTKAEAQQSPYTPYQHKALYLFNFAKYTEWPKSAFPNDKSPFVLGILGNDPFGSDIDIIKGKTIKGRKLVVRHLNSAREAADCHLL